MTNIAEVLSEKARSHPQRSAIKEIVKGRVRSTSFAELENASAAIASTLRSHGIQSGDDVFVLHPVTAELYAIILAVFRLGGTVMLLDPSAGQEHIRRCCSLRPPSAFVGSRKSHLLRLMNSSLRVIPKKFVMGGWVPGAILLNTESPRLAIDIKQCGADHPALLTFTSGGTGIPKAAVRTHGFLLAQNQVLSRTLELSSGGIDLATLPVFVLANIAAGVSTIIPHCDLRYPGQVDAFAVIDQIEEEQPDSTACSPAFIERLAHASLKHQRPLNSFRRIYTGGAPVSPQLMDMIAQAAPNARVIAVYGSTEAEPIAEIPLDQISSQHRSRNGEGGGLPAGKPVDEINLRILKDSWGTPLGTMSTDQLDQLSLPMMARGEIVVSGDHVLKGYLDGRGDEETKFDVDGVRWHRTGDAGYLDENQELWLLGRCHSIIRDERGELYPFAVEMVALQHPSVARTALVPHNGQRVLIAELKPGSKLSVKESLLTLVSWALLDDIRIVEKIPVDKRHNAKIDYPRLKEMLG